MDRFSNKWDRIVKIDDFTYQCGYCNTYASPSMAWVSEDVYYKRGYIVICPGCNKPSFVIVANQEVIYKNPGAKFGVDIEGLPDTIKGLYEEARLCSSVGAYTSTVMICRTLLMHVAVENGAQKGGGFVEYVNFLNEKGYIPTNGFDWVDSIRNKGNIANHEIVVMSYSDAEDMLVFTEMLLRLIFEFRYRLSKDKKRTSQS